MMQTPIRLRSLHGAVPALCAALLATGCARPRPVVLQPVVDADRTALALEDETSLVDPIRIIFGWQLNESGIRVRGRGVARIEPPYKARLDLFLGNGETVVRAALVDGDLRLPPGAPDNILPPADLMWGTLGVFRPELGTELVGADHIEGDAVRLRYLYPDRRELHYQVADGLLRRLELIERGSVVQWVEIEPEEGGRFPRVATYRNLAAFRELKITRESLETVEPYPADIWDPIGEPDE